MTLTVSLGPNLVTVPSVVGQQQATAETAIRQAGLKPRSVNQNADEPAGTVTDESPTAGTSVDKGSVVTITVSNGAGSVVVPNVVGQTESAARSTLELERRSQGQRAAPDDHRRIAGRPRGEPVADRRHAHPLERQRDDLRGGVQADDDHHDDTDDDHHADDHHDTRRRRDRAVA